MLGQLPITCLRLWSTIRLDNPTGAIGPPRSRTWHYYFQLIQQPLKSATWRGGLFLFHKDHLSALLCKQPLIQELTISVSELQFCSLFPVSFSNCRRPLQPQEMAAPLSVFFKPEKDPSSRLQNWVFSSPKIRAFWSSSCDLTDRLYPSYLAHHLGLSLQFLGVLHFIFIWSLTSTHPGLVLEAGMPSVASTSKICPLKLSRRCLLTPSQGT